MSVTIIIMNIQFLLVFFLSFFFLLVFRKVAIRIGLVDKPNARKQHQGSIPLVGGISLYFVLAIYLLFSQSSLYNSGLYFFSITVLITIGVLDDKYDVSFKLRLIIQTLLALFAMHDTGFQLQKLGNLLGSGDINIGYLSIIFTVLAVIGSINAFNMVDGIDGLLGCLSIISFASLAILLSMANQYWALNFCIIFIIALVPYVLMNLGVLGQKRKVFMGDAGSMLIGMTIVWLLISASQLGDKAPMRPITAVWIIAVPLMDMAAIMIRRVRRGHSPFKPDREHLHHICQRLGLSSNQTLLFICFISLICSAFGIYGEYAHISESIMFSVFICSFLLYSLVISYIWRITTFFRKLKN